MDNKLTVALRESWFHRYLTKDEENLILINSNIVRYNRRDVIFKQNTRTSHIMFLLSGLVKVYKTGRNNKALTYSILKKGNFISFYSIFGDTIFQSSASAVDEVEIMIIDYATFVSIIQQNGNFAMGLIRRMSKDGLFLADRLMSLSHKQLPGRIAEVILYFSQEIYNDVSFDFPLTRVELAEMAGTTKESFIRTINEFKHDKIITLDGRHINIVSMDIIKVLSELG